MPRLWNYQILLLVHGLVNGQNPLVKPEILAWYWHIYIAPFALSCRLSALLKLLPYFNSRHKTLHFGEKKTPYILGENFMKIGSKSYQCLKVSSRCIPVQGIYCGMGLFFITCLDTMDIKWHMVPSFLYDHAKSALPSTPLPSNPSWSTEWKVQTCFNTII